MVHFQEQQGTILVNIVRRQRSATLIFGYSVSEILKMKL